MKTAADVARLMRETADLIERGIIQHYEIKLDFDHDRITNPRTGMMEFFYTGNRTVTIVLHGNDSMRDWGPNPNAAFPVILQRSQEPKLIEQRQSAATQCIYCLQITDDPDHRCAGVQSR